jgi:hypothetical protein
LVALFAVLISTFVGVAVGTLMVLLFSPAAFLVFAFGIHVLWWLPFAFALPTTILALPLIHIVVPHPFFRTICLLAGGTLCGALTVLIVLKGSPAAPASGTILEAIFLAGGFAGFAAAAAFDAVAREAD